MHLQAGQCGNQIGAKFWEVSCLFYLLVSWYVNVSLITPHVCDVSGVVGLTLCVCSCVSLSWPKGQTCRLEFCH